MYWVDVLGLKFGLMLQKDQRPLAAAEKDKVRSKGAFGRVWATGERMEHLQTRLKVGTGAQARGKDFASNFAIVGLGASAREPKVSATDNRVDLR